MFQGKRIWVTGASGLIGSHLVRALLDNGAGQVIASGRKTGRLTSCFARLCDRQRLLLLEHDSGQTDIPDACCDLDYIFHAAGPMERDIVMQQPVSVISPNITGILSLCSHLKHQEETTGKKGRLMVFSSVTVYNNPSNQDIHVSESDTSHATPLHAPVACYSESKRMSEVIALSFFRQYQLDIVIARLSTVYGCTVHIPDTAFYESLTHALKGEDILFRGSGFPRRDNIYIHDAVNALLLLALRGEAGEAYNVSSGGWGNQFAAIDEIAETIISQIRAIRGGTPSHVITPGRLPRKAGIILDNAKLRSLGWQPRYTLDEGIKETILDYIDLHM